MGYNTHYRKGNKIGGRHTSIIDAAREFIRTAEKSEEVTKIVVGRIISGVKGGRHKVKFKEIRGGILLTIRGSTSIQEVLVFSNNVEDTRRMLENVL